MAFRTHRTTIMDDLDISDSDDDETELGCNPNARYVPVNQAEEDKLLAYENDDDDESERDSSDDNEMTVEVASGNAVDQPGAMGFFIDKNANEQVGGSSVHSPETVDITNEMDSEGCIRINHGSEDTTTYRYNRVLTTSNFETRPSVSREATYETLDEICRKRNILPAARAPRHRSFQDAHLPITGTRKMLNVNPREVSLDEVIKTNKSFQDIPTVGRGGYRGRGRGTFQHYRSPNITHSQYRRQPQLGGNGRGRRDHAKETNKLKLQRGLGSILESEGGLNVLGNALSNMQISGLPKFIPDPWQAIGTLNESGYGTYYVMRKLKQDEDLDEELSGRIYKCTIEYNNISGVCEAPGFHQARNGAAADFLKKLCAQFPKIGPMPTKVPDEQLMGAPSSAMANLLARLKFLRKVDFTAKFQYDTVNAGERHALTQCVMSIDPYKYEGYSYNGPDFAKLNVIKRAYEDLGKEPYPFIRIYMGEVECTTDSSLYKDVESKKVHCCDLSRTTVYKPGTIQHIYKRGSGRKQGPARFTCGGNVMVSFEEPVCR